MGIGQQEKTPSLWTPSASYKARRNYSASGSLSVKGLERQLSKALSEYWELAGGLEFLEQKPLSAPVIIDGSYGHHNEVVREYGGGGVRRSGGWWYDHMRGGGDLDS